MIRVKRGVDLTHLSGEMALAAVVVDQVYGVFGRPTCWITSGRDGPHMDGSKHTRERIEALDFRTRDWPAFPSGGGLETMAEVLRDRLGPAFQVILEETHMHVEHDP